jgi:arginyl-tRNA synthetase
MQLKSTINATIQEAFKKAQIDHTPISVTEATKPEFGDYQFNGAMALAKVLKKNPREIASMIVEAIDSEGVISKAQIAGPGFINLWINPLWLASKVQEAQKSDRLGILTREGAMRVVVDYSGPNMAKQMHVGHLRSTIIGDSIANLLEFLGDEVIRQNHIGDWGTQFGMLVAYLEEQQSDGVMALGDLESFYKEAKKRFDEDPSFATKSREYVVKIQSGDAHCLGLWQKFINSSLDHCEEVYRTLDVKLKREDVRAESFYNDDLPKVVAELEQKEIAVESNGAKCIFLAGEDTPLIIQKQDGGYLYATTDISALRFRANTLEADRILYVVDARQSGHFKQVFRAVKEAEFVDQHIALEHIGFGTMMDRGGKPFKTRDGGTVKLVDLLHEAISRAKASIRDQESYTPQALEAKAKIIGIGAVKYADLSMNRDSNYIFDWDKMLALEGNTSVYMLYAYARIASIFRRFEGEMGEEVILIEPLEHRLAVKLLSFEDTLWHVSTTLYPHHITTYLYELATLFMRFYEHHPILKEGVDHATQQSRLALASLTAQTIKKGLDILGIEVVDRL